MAKFNAERRGPASAAPPGLVYLSDAAPGIRRVRRGRAFAYLRPDGQPLRDADELSRIRQLAIPPAYTDVWISPQRNGHLQATGRDTRGRKQYRYHADWCQVRDSDKFDRLYAFGQALPRLRRRVDRDLARRAGGLPTRDAVLAALVRLLDTTLVRVGNEEYARSNHSYGLTTLRSRHAQVHGATLRLRFVGKGGKCHDVSLADARVAKIVRRCQALPGQELFAYVDAAGQVHRVGSADVNGYLREATGCDFTAKDFRTWHASALALDLVRRPAADGAPRSTANEVLLDVAARLGNTVAVCKKAYVHPRVLELAGADASRWDALAAYRAPAALRACEQALMRLLAATAPARRRRRAAAAT